MRRLGSNALATSPRARSRSPIARTAPGDLRRCRGLRRLGRRSTSPRSQERVSLSRLDVIEDAIRSRCSSIGSTSFPVLATRYDRQPGISPAAFEIAAAAPESSRKNQRSQPLGVLPKTLPDQTVQSVRSGATHPRPDGSVDPQRTTRSLFELVSTRSACKAFGGNVSACARRSPGEDRTRRTACDGSNEAQPDQTV